MKNLLFIFFVFLCTSLSATEYGYLYHSDNEVTNEISINAGDIFEVINHDSKFHNGIRGGMRYDILSFTLPNGKRKIIKRGVPVSVTSSLGGFPSGNIILSGPTNISLDSHEEWLCYKLTRASK